MNDLTPLLEEFITYENRCGSCKYRGFKGYCQPTGVFRETWETCNRYELKRGE
jgi:hypothetical protein